MRIVPIKTIPQDVYIAFSGGVDSVVLLHRSMQQKRNVTIAFYNHGTEFSHIEEDFAVKTANDHGIPIIIGRNYRPIVGSKEKFWRDSRYEFFHSLENPVATGHNLDDCVEWYIMTCLRGEGHYMEYNNKNVIRPLLTVAKTEIIKYAVHHQLNWLDDASNSDVEFTPRNRVRHNIIPECLKVNEGLYSIVKKRIHQKCHQS